MRFTRTYLVLVATFFLGCLRAADSAGPLTLEQALASVDHTNINVLLSREATAQALEQVTVARSALLPSLGGAVQQRRTKTVTITNRTATISGPANRFDAQVTGNYAVIDPQHWSASRSARVGLEIARADYDAVFQSVMTDVADSFFAHLRNLKRLDVLDANIARAQTLLKLARDQLNVGIVTQIDVTRAESQLAQAEQARLQQLTSDYQSELLLKRLLDIDPAQPLQLADFTVRRADASLLSLGDEKTTFEKRADYLRAQKVVEQAKLDVRTATFERLPSLGLSGQYGLGSPNFDERGKEEWTAGAALSMPIFDGFRIGADRRIALARQRSQELRLHNLELQISSELRLAAQDASSRNAQVTVAVKNLELAQQQLRLAQQRYQNGVADNREVVEAQTQLAIADDNLVEAVYQYNLSRVELARARGDVRTVLTEKGP